MGTPSSTAWMKWVAGGLMAALAFLGLWYFLPTHQPPTDPVTVREEAARKFVAVLPFQNLSPNPEDEFFADGITEDIITHLSKIEALGVIARTTSMISQLPGSGLRRAGPVGRSRPGGEVGRAALPVSKEAYRGLYRVEDLARIYAMVGDHDAACDAVDVRADFSALRRGQGKDGVYWRHFRCGTRRAFGKGEDGIEPVALRRQPTDGAVEPAMGTHDYDIIIVGGGVAGSCAATALAPYGYRILLLERAVFPRDKPCGEGIMPQGIAVLDKLGVLSHLLAAGAVKFKGLRYRGLDGTWAQAEFPSLQDVPQYGLAMRRLQLDELLVNRARAFPNVAVREGFTVTGVILEGPAVAGIFGASSERNKVESFRAPLTVAADGRDSVFPNKCGLTKRFLRRKRFGITGHLEGMRGLGSWVEVLLHEDGEIYIAPCGSDTALVALLVEKRSVSFFKGDLPARYMEFLRSFPRLEDRLAGTQLLPPVFAVGPLGFRVSPCYHPGLLLIGDSGGFLDPITGQGMTLALKQVEAAVPVISRAFQSGDFSARSLSGYAAARARLTKDLFLLTRLLLRFSRPRVLAGRAIRRLARDVALFQKLLAIASGARPYRDLSVGEKLSLLIG